MTIIFDIDGILCDDNNEPIPGALEKVMQYLSQGHSILYWTARPEIDRLITANWLNQHGFPNAPLFMGKPQGDIYIDDRAVSTFKELDKRLNT